MKLPKNAKLVYKGIIFDVYQWQQEMFDGSIETFEALKRPATVQIIPTLGKNKLILAKEQQPSFTKERISFLGGRQEPNEEPLQTAQRELLEESGLKSNDWELLKIDNHSGKIDWTVYTFIARNCEKISEQKLDPGEKISLLEVNFDEYVNIVSSNEFSDKISSNEVLKMKYEGGLEEYNKKLFKD